MCDIQARCRWLLTGTPINNSAWDMYACFYFLRYKPMMDSKFFKRHLDLEHPKYQRLLARHWNAVVLRRQNGMVSPTSLPHSLYPNLAQLTLSFYVTNSPNPFFCSRAWHWPSRPKGDLKEGGFQGQGRGKIIQQPARKLAETLQIVEASLQRRNLVAFYPSGLNSILLYLIGAQG
jgi:hypothetical protein